MLKNLKPLLLITAFSLTSCGVKLRKDIKDFLDPISFNNARNNVKKGHFIDKNEGKVNGQDFVFYEEIEFEIGENKAITYMHKYKSVNYGSVRDDEYEESISMNENKYIFTDKNGGVNELSYDAAFNKTNRFFYSDYYEQSNHHYGAMYYGDILKSEAAKLQDFITISDNKEILTYNIDGFKSDSQVGTAIMKINYSVNKLGMLLSLVDEGHIENNDTSYFRETIEATY